MAYLKREPEYNLFLIGDLENYGLESQDVSAYTADGWREGDFPYLLLDYRGSFLFYSANPDFPALEVAQYLKTQRLHNLSGKLELIEKLAAHMNALEIVPTYLAKLDTIKDLVPFPDTKRLGEHDVKEICGLLRQTDEFYTMKSKTPEENQEDVLASITHGGRMYGIFEGAALKAVAGTTAENSISAMVVSVATLAPFRKRGYASQLVSRLCDDCLKEGMEFLCLFYDNPRAGSIYRRLGFREVGEYAMVKTRTGS